MLIFAVVIGALATVRGTIFFTDDRLTLGYRRYAVNKFGENSLAAYFVHCAWCTSIWVGGLLMAPTVLLFSGAMSWPQRLWVAFLATLAASLAAGLTADRRE